MLTEKAIVQKTEAGYVWLEPRQADLCGKCSMHKGCGHRLLDFMRGKEDPLLKVRCPEQSSFSSVKAGDIVTVGLDEGKLVRIAGLMYGIPLLILVVLASLGSVLALGELTLFALVVLGLIAAVALSRKWATRLENNSLLALSVERRVPLIPVATIDPEIA